MRIPQTIEEAKRDVETIGLLHTFVALREALAHREDKSHWADCGRAKRRMKQIAKGVIEFCISSEGGEAVRLFADLELAEADSEAEVSTRGDG